MELQDTPGMRQRRKNSDANRSIADAAVAKSLLRLPDEPCTHFSDPEIHAALVADPAGFMRRFFEFYAHWARVPDCVEQPPKLVFDRSETSGDFRVMPCVVSFPDGTRAKVVKVIGTNEAGTVVRDKISVGKALLLHPQDHFVKATMDVAALSSFRTAAVSALAFERLTAPAGPSTVATGLVGCGRIGFYTALILASWLGVRRIVACEPDGDVLEKFRAAVEKWIPGLAVDAGSLAGVLNDAQAVFLATTSRKPLLDNRNAGHLQFVSSAGADADNLSELDFSLTRGRRVVVDTLQSMEYGDLGRWHHAGRIRPEDLCDLRSCFAERRNGHRGSALFISTGAAVQDAIICHALEGVLTGESVIGSGVQKGSKSQR